MCPVVTLLYSNTEPSRSFNLTVGSIRVCCVNYSLFTPDVISSDCYRTTKSTDCQLFYASCCSYLLEQDFPGMRIGPEPTTDSFIAVMHSDIEGLVPGNALVVDPKKPFRKLNAFGNAFLNRSVWPRVIYLHHNLCFCSAFKSAYML